MENSCCIEVKVKKDEYKNNPNYALRKNKNIKLTAIPTVRVYVDKKYSFDNRIIILIYISTFLAY